MANLNLSEFGEKLFVADADHTFIWDTAASISKRVSRNSWLNSGTLTSDAPVTISQTWNAVGQTFKALVVNAAGTSDANSASGSLLLDLQVGTVSQFSVTKAGAVNATGAVSTPAQFIAGDAIFANGNGVRYVSTWIRSAGFDGGLLFRNNTQTQSVGVVVDAANTLALRNGAAAQTFNVYGTWSSITDYRRLSISCDNTTGNATITANKGSATTGDVGTVSINGIAAASGGNSLTFAGANGSVLAQSNYINLQSNAYAAFQALGARGAGNEPSSLACIYGPNSGTIDATSAFKIYRRTGGVDSVPFMVNSAGNVGIGTTSPTSKLHVVGDAVLTGQLLGSNYTVGTADSVTQSNIAITNNHVGFADSFFVLTPKGTGGVIFGPKPDGTSTGGNARGIYSVDLQTSAKTGPAQVASGAYSALVGGQANRASGAHSFCGGGNSNTPSGTFSVTCGGQSNIASGGQSFIGGGIGNTASSTNAFIAGGIQGLADRYGISAHSSGQIATPGDAQKTTAVFRNKTTTNSAVELFLDGASARYTVTSGKIISMLINITGTKSDGSAVAHYVRQYSIKNIGGTTSQVYAAVTVGTDYNPSGTAIAISADDTNDSLKIEVTGVTSETWRWVASVDAVEVGHGV